MNELFRTRAPHSNTTATELSLSVPVLMPCVKNNKLYTFFFFVQFYNVDYAAALQCNINLLL